MSSMAAGEIGLAGLLTAKVITKRERERASRRKVRAWHLRNWIENRWRELPFQLFVCLLPVLRWFIPALCVFHSRLYVTVRRANGDIEDYGLVGRHLIVTAGKNFVAGAFNNTNEPESLKYHGLGTGITAAAVGDTALQTELTTQYNPDSTRATGSQAVSTNVYTTVGTNTLDAGAAVTEWGLFTQAATGGGTLLDRQVFSALNLSASDSLQTTYALTVG